MYRFLLRVYYFLKHRLIAYEPDSIPNPNAARIIAEVITQPLKPELLKPITEYRYQALNNHTRVQITDYGKTPARTYYRSIAQIAQGSGKPLSQAELLYRFSKTFQGDNLIELGTNLGISTAYLAISDNARTVFTFEGAPEIARVAQQYFNETGLFNIKLIKGNIDQTLPEFLLGFGNEKINLAFLDANHRYAPTLNYYRLLKPYLAETSAVIIDDIYHNPGMVKAWKSLCKTETDTLCLDFYFWGVIIKGYGTGHFSVKIPS